MSVAAVVTNLGLIIMTDNRFKLGVEMRWILFVVVEHALLVLLFILQSAIPDETDETSDIKARHRVVI